MAEAAGLALSGVALIGLFSTCIEFLEYFEQSKSWARDVRLARTKINLMKNRLSQWGTVMSIDAPIAQIELLQSRWPTESEVIMDCLRRIRDILDDTSCMCRKYNCIKDNIDGLQWLQPRATRCGSSVSLPSPASLQLSSARSWSRRKVLKTVHLKITWVIQDRKRFQELITDFEFLLNHLEKMGERFQKASSAAKLPERPSETTDDMDYPMTDAEHMTECHDTSPAVASYSHFSGTNPAPLDGNDSNRGKKPITSKSPENPALDTYHYPTRRQGEHVFQENVPSGHALIHMGDYYGKDVVSKSGQGHFYVKNRPKDHTTAQFGNTDGETVQAIVRARLEHDRSEDSSCTTAVKEEI